MPNEEQNLKTSKGRGEEMLHTKDQNILIYWWIYAMSQSQRFCASWRTQHSRSILITHHQHHHPPQRNREKEVMEFYQASKILLPSTREYKGQRNMSLTPQRFIQQHPGCRKRPGKWHSFLNKSRSEKDTEGYLSINDNLWIFCWKI